MDTRTDYTAGDADVVAVLTSPLRSVCTMKAVSEFSGRRGTLWLSVPGMNELNQTWGSVSDKLRIGESGDSLGVKLIN